MDEHMSGYKSSTTSTLSFAECHHVMTYACGHFTRNPPSSGMQLAVHCPSLSTLTPSHLHSCLPLELESRPAASLTTHKATHSDLIGAFGRFLSPPRICGPAHN